MGLDSFWVMPEGKETIVFSPSLQVCGGMFSNAKMGSFRGKIYAELIQKISGISLYQDKISNEDILHISNRLEETVKSGEMEDAVKSTYYDLNKQEIKDLCRMFKKFGQAGASLINSW